jgi:WD40 repeat protein
VGTGKEILTFINDSEHPIFELAISPDGRTALSGSRELKLWDIATGKEIYTLAKGDRVIVDVGYSADGRTVWAIFEYSSKTLQLWDVSTGKEVRTFPSDLAELPYRIHMSPDGRFALAQYSTHTDYSTGRQSGRNARVLWDLYAGTEKVIDTHVPRVEPIAWSLDGRTVVGMGDKLRLWDIASGEEIISFGAYHWTNDLAFLPDSRTVVSGGRDHNLALWDVKAGAKIHVFTGHTSEIRSVALSRDGRMALTAGGRDVKLWDLTKF